LKSLCAQISPVERAEFEKRKEDDLLERAGRRQ
jgi:hypothetical protein